jgi:hypothetical protein
MSKSPTQVRLNLKKPAFEENKYVSLNILGTIDSHLSSESKLTGGFLTTTVNEQAPSQRQYQHKLASLSSSENPRSFGQHTLSTIDQI